jgi:hypothetical protein
MSDPDYDDRCDDEQREADISRAHSADCMAAYGVPYDDGRGGRMSRQHDAIRSPDSPPGSAFGAHEGL